MWTSTRTLSFAVVMMLAAVSLASAQSSSPGGQVMFHWGPVHLAPGQAIAINFELTDHLGGPLTLPVELQLEDKSGNLIYRGEVAVEDGHAVTFAIGPEIRLLRSLPADLYAAVGPEIRLLQPCLKVTFPPGPTSPVDRMTLTLEIIDVTTGRVVAVANNPHAIIGVLAQ